MKKKYIDSAQYANVIAEALRKGAFLTTKAGEKVNSMVIGWGHVGRIWERDVFVAYVRKSRFTRELLDETQSSRSTFRSEKSTGRPFPSAEQKAGATWTRSTNAPLH